MATKIGREGFKRERFTSLEAQSPIYSLAVTGLGQFDGWIEDMNIAIRKMGGSTQFGSADIDQAISYWYVLSFIAGAWEQTAGHRGELVGPNELQFSAGVISMERLVLMFENVFKEETVRKYVTSLRSFRLIERSGTGASAMLKISMPAIFALASNWQRWHANFTEFDVKIKLRPLHLKDPTLLGKSLFSHQKPMRPVRK